MSSFGKFHAVTAIVIAALAAAGCAGSNAASQPSAPPYANGANLYSDFSSLSDGPAPLTFDSGQPASVASVLDPSMQLRVLNGKLTYSPANVGPAAGYFRTPDLGRPIRRIGMEWTVAPGTAGPGIAAMGITSAPMDAIRPDNSPMALHLIIQRDGWGYSVSPGTLPGDPQLITLRSGTFEPKLLEDGTTVYRTEVRIDGPHAIVSLPDGSEVAVSDSRIAAWAGRFGFFEAFSGAGSIDGKVGLVRVWAEA
jgi:hypothetical protein